MSRYELVKKYYEAGLWNDERVRNAVKKGWLSEAEYAELTGKDY